MTPGRYLKLRRQAAGISIGDAMAVIGGGALLSAPLAEIEAEEAMPTAMDGALLAWAFALDAIVLSLLVDGEPVRVCESCGCSQADPCEPRVGLFCHWVAADLCSGCRGLPAAMAVAA